MTFPGQTPSEILAQYEKDRKVFVNKALKGEVKWGAWRYNPNNLTLEIDSEVSGYPPDNPYYVDLEWCSDSFHILDTLCQLLDKFWCPVEQVGYLLKAIDELSGGIQAEVLPAEKDNSFSMSGHLRGMDRTRYGKLLKVNEAAQILRVSKLSIYRMINDGKLNAIRLPIGRNKKGELRISENGLNKLLRKKSSNNEA